MRRFAPALLAFLAALLAAPCGAATAEQQARYAAARAWNVQHLGPLGLAGRSLQSAFERLSEAGLACSVESRPMLFCRLPAAALPPGCPSLSVMVSSEDAAWPEAHDPIDRVADVLGRRAAPPSVFCSVALDPFDGKFLPMTLVSTASLHDAADTLARAAPDLQLLEMRLLAADANCSLIPRGDSRRLSCDGQSLQTPDCTDASAVFEAPAMTGAAPHVVEVACRRGRYVPPEPDRNDHDRWAELGVVVIAQMCATQSPAWRHATPLERLYGRASAPDWGQVEASADGRCLRERHPIPDALCGAVSKIDLEDARQAKAFIEDHQPELKRVQPALDSYGRAPGQRREGAAACDAWPAAVSTPQSGDHQR